MEPGKSGSLRVWVEASSVVAAALYALGWIFTAGVLARFEVTPEEVGFTFASLLIRVVSLFIAVVAFVVLVVVPLHRFEITDISMSLNDERTMLIVIAGFIMVGAVPFFITVGWRREILLPIFCLLISLVAAVVRRLAARGWIRYILALISVVAFLAVPFLAADRYADQIEEGKELRPPILPGIAGLSIQLVQATTTDDEPISPELGPSACVHLLGSSGGTVVLYKHHDPGLVIRVPQERVSLEDPCSSVR